MKKFLLVAVALLLSACASNKEFYQMQESLITQVKEMKAKELELKLEQQRTRTAYMNSVAKTLDPSGAAALGVALALADRGGGASQEAASNDLLKMVALQRPPESWDDKALKWASVLLGGYKIFVDKEVGIANVTANRDMQTALYAMIGQINRDTGNAVGAAGQRPAPPPTYQITVNGDGNGLLGGTGSTTTDASTLTLTCSSTGAPGGDGGAGDPANPGGSGAAGGGSPVTCSVTR